MLSLRCWGRGSGRVEGKVRSNLTPSSLLPCWPRSCDKQRALLCCHGTLPDLAAPTSVSTAESEALLGMTAGVP